jgi:hypothetical protein
MALEDIERELNLLKTHLGDHGGKIDEVLAGVKNLQPDHLHEYSEAFETGLPYVTDGVIDAIAAGKSGDPFAISIASLSVFSGFLTMAGPLTGPAGPLLSALTGLLSTILGQFLPPGKSLQQELTEVFQKFYAQGKLDELGKAADQIWRFVDTIERGDTGKPERRPWKPLNLQHGTEIGAVDSAWQWLANAENQSLPQWGIVLEKTCRLFTQLLEAVTVSVAYPSTRDGAKPGEMLLNVPSAIRLFLDYVRKITLVAQQRGTFWHLASNTLYSYDESGGVYTCDSILGAPDWKRLYGVSRAMTVTLNQGQQGQSRPVVTLLTLEPPWDALPGTDTNPGDSQGDTVSYDKNHPFIKPNNRTYGISGEWPSLSAPWPQLKGNDSSHPLEGCYDIFALPADERKDEQGHLIFEGGTFFYTANGNEIRGYVQDKDGKVSFVWSYPVAGGRKVGSIRVVDNVNNLRGFQSDPDENPKGDPGVLKDIVWIIYGGCEVPSGGMDILVRFRDKKGGEGEGYVRVSRTTLPKTPWPNFRGIGVDRRYLWVYRAGDIACATHTAIMKALKEKRAPSWMECSIPEGVVQRFSRDENRLNGLLDLSPCDDGTLFAAFIQGNWNHSMNRYQLFMLTPRIDLQKRTLALQAADFVRIPGEGFRVGKQPLFCWSLLEEVTSTLEEQTAPSKSSNRTAILDAAVAKLEVLHAPPAP